MLDNPQLITAFAAAIEAHRQGFSNTEHAMREVIHAMVLQDQESGIRVQPPDITSASRRVTA